MNRIRSFSVRDVIREMGKTKHGLLYAFTLALIALPLAALSFLTRTSLFLTIPFLYLPFLFASIMMILDPDANKSLSNRVYFSYFSLYFRPPFQGVFRVIRNFFIAFGFAVASGIIAYFVSYAILIRTDADFAEAVNHLYELLQAGEFITIYNFMLSSEPLLFMVNLVSGVAAVVLFFVFAHQIMFYGFAVYIRSSLQAPSSVANFLYRGAIKANRPSFRKSYWGSLFPLFLIILGAMVGGFFLARLVPSFTLNEHITGGIALGLFVLSLCLPYYTAYISLSSEHYRFIFLDYSIQVTEKELAEMAPGSPEYESLKEALDSAKTARSQLENMEKEEKEKPAD